MNPRSHSTLVALQTVESDGKREPPKAFRLFSAGKVKTTKGTFTFDAASAVSVMEAASDWGNDFPVDYAHAMVLGGGDPAKDGRAAGWFTPAVRDGELWATSVEWCATAQEMLSAREYRYCSPTFEVDEAGRILSLINVALTNLPATKNAPPLMASAAAPDSHTLESAPMKNLLVALGLAETAPETEALSALETVRKGAVELLSALEAKSTGEALGKLAALRQDAARAVELSAKLAEREEADKQAELSRLLEQGTKDMKIPPAQLSYWTTVGQKDLEQLKGYLSVAAPFVHTKSTAAKEDARDASSLTESEVRVAKLLGQDLGELAKSKAAAGAPKFGSRK